MLLRDPSERELKDFIVAHHRDIFGHYDKLETELWLRFPEVDIAGKERRLDIFMRNSVSGDWELFELKKPIHVLAKYRDTPTMAAEVVHAIQQLKNYDRILRNSHVKESLKRNGIEYFEPTLNLVIGRTPAIRPEQWQYLLSCHARDVRIFTYDNLVAEMKQRYADRLHFLKQLSGKR